MSDGALGLSERWLQQLEIQNGVGGIDMRKILLSLLIATLGFTAAQDVGRAAPPSVDALWALLGSISTVEVEIRSPEVRNVLLVTMYQGEAVISNSEEITGERNYLIMLSAGALRPGIGEGLCLSGVPVFVHYRKTHEGRAIGEGHGLRCFEIEGLIGLSQTRPSLPLQGPMEGNRDPSALPLDTWLLFGITDLFGPDRGESANQLEHSLAHYFLLSTELVIPPPDQWELPAYETWREAEEAFE